MLRKRDDQFNCLPNSTASAIAASERQPSPFQLQEGTFLYPLLQNGVAGATFTKPLTKSIMPLCGKTICGDAFDLNPFVIHKAAFDDSAPVLAAGVARWMRGSFSRSRPSMCAV